MRSLFLKIFLWFGLTMVLVNVASFFTGVITERRSQNQRTSPLAPMFGVFTQTAAETFEREGKPALDSYLERVESASHINAVLFNQNGEAVSDRAVSAMAKDVALRASQSPTSEFVYLRQPQPLGSQTVRLRSGAQYTLVGTLPRPDFPRPPPRFGEPGSFLFGFHILGRQLLPILLIGGALCYWLARYLSRPIVNLRGTTQELADGVFTARVDQQLVKRRDEIGHLGRDFNLMADRIESLINAQQRLLADISHELRSPLARLGVALGLARRRTGPEANPVLDRIGREAQRLNEMIGQLLTLSREESGTDNLKNIKIDLCAVVREIADDADFEARSRNRSVRVAPCEPCETMGVVELLRSAIENVIRNAVYYTSEGTEVQVEVRRERGGEEQHAVISVRDSGAGVPQDAIDKIFRPFYRVEDARDRQSGGTGLGLAIAARAVHLHNGTIKAANSPEGGLIVELRLPIRDFSYQAKSEPKEHLFVGNSSK